ncbi:FAD-dependent monooxygenase [Pedobacter metabolipauper]|uniref:2-polyprenyl-6-methoxyphenol hydroxylase-like FAD-dependent oxidoreductase n=1 Tax=Pedobacter metabolipauper TaxID=425513 RepID=A0A4R6T2Q0_9SPHI|nr:FAD-dependent monooxygenase [Pedobacter metabolipauper]TDQ11820.1 2-polyprenyl-6-methoxyphenol hydroxylase-like FAD-dependent oxidoreductase [Pedobacter metabolipauper]
MKNKKILISGASIAGPTLAYWLSHYGFDVIVTEKARELRLGGQNIDVKGPAREIAQMMGIEEKIRAANTTEIGTRFVDTANKIVAEFPKGESIGLTQELEILRGDLVKILYECSKEKVEYRFGDQITSVSQTDIAVNVSFASGKEESFDILISAEGIGSKTMELVFGSQPDFKYLGLYTAYLTIPKEPSDSKWARWCNALSGIIYLMRPDNHGETRASVTFLATEDEYKGLSMEEQKDALIQRIKGTGWESDRITEGIKRSKDFYFERVSQVKASSWSRGRVAITGDAAWCATPIAGKGTDLAMAGAYILAGELSRADTIEQAFRAYEDKMRPYVEKSQQLPPGIPWVVYPRTKFGIFILNRLVAAVGSKPVKWLVGKLSSGKKVPGKEIVLPDYK